MNKGYEWPKNSYFEIKISIFYNAFNKINKNMCLCIQMKKKTTYFYVYVYLLIIKIKNKKIKNSILANLSFILQGTRAW